METYDHVHSHFGVYAIIKRKDLVVNPEAEEVLLVRKALGPYKGLLDLPGGSPDELETLEDALVREIKEETGAKATTFKQLAAVSTIYEYQSEEGKSACLRHIGVLYDVSIAGDVSYDCDAEDVAGCGWYKISTLKPNEITPFVLQVL